MVSALQTCPRLSVKLESATLTRTSAVVATKGVRPMLKFAEAPDRSAEITAEPLVDTTEAVAEKVAEVAPEATGTEAGTVNAVLLLENDTTAPLAGAARFRVTVQVLVALDVRTEGLQETPVGMEPVTRLREKTVEEPDRDAMMVAVLSKVIVEAVAVNVAEVAPGATVTETGTVNNVVLMDKLMTAPPAEAALLRVTVQAAEVLEVSVSGSQMRLVGTVFVTRLREKLTEEPDSDAVMTAVLSVVIVEAVAEKVAEVAPAATVTEAGTVSRALFLERETTAPPVGAALLRVTVQVAEL